MIYGLKIVKQENGKFRVTCRDIPECDFEEDTLEAAVKSAGHVLPGAMVLCYRQKKKAIPLPSKLQKDESPCRVPLKVQAKILFWNFMVNNGLRIADVARKLEISHTEASRLVDLTHDSASIDTVEAAAEKLGVHFTLTVETLPA